MVGSNPSTYHLFDTVLVTLVTPVTPDKEVFSSLTRFGVRLFSSSKPSPIALATSFLPVLHILPRTVIAVAHVPFGVSHPKFQHAVRTMRLAEECISETPEGMKAPHRDSQSGQQGVQFATQKVDLA